MRTPFPPQDPGRFPLSHFVRVQRQRLKMTLAALGDRVGLGTTFLSKLENGEKDGTERVDALASALRTTPKRLTRLMNLQRAAKKREEAKLLERAS